MKKKSLLVAMVTCGILSSVLSGFLVMASNDDIFFTFRIGSYQENGRDSHGRYRQTNDVNNPWKVKMTYTGEGSNTITNYWMENSATTNVTPTVSVTQGKGYYYENAYSSANGTTVYLTAENNNFNGSAYNVSGYWDEETW